MSLISSKSSGDEVMAEINITPFTDVLLVLLIIFMILAALITPPGFQKQLPNKSTHSPTNEEKRKSIEVDVAKRRGKLHVSIIADAKAPYGLIIRILDAARQASLEDVGFVTS